jgi:hypothetical protein
MNDTEWAKLWAGAADRWTRCPAGPSVATGGGLSAFVARRPSSTAALARGDAARYVPLGQWSVASRSPTRAAVGVVFSVGLSPNARLALRPGLFDQTFVVTAASAERCAELCPHAVRVGLSSARGRGPFGALAAPMAAVAKSESPLDPRPRWQARSAASPDLVIHGPGLEAPARGLAWAWTEHARTPLPPVVAALDFAHGPLQALRRGSGVWVLPTPGLEPLVARVRRALTGAGARWADFGAQGGRWGSWVRALATAARFPPGASTDVDDGSLYGIEQPLGVMDGTPHGP